MTYEQPALKDDAFYEPLFERILVKLQETGQTDLEIFIGELFPIIPADFDGEDVYEAIMRLVAHGVIQHDDCHGNRCITFIEE